MAKVAQVNTIDTSGHGDAKSDPESFLGPESPISTADLPSIQHTQQCSRYASLTPLRELEIYQPHPQALVDRSMISKGQIWILTSQGRPYGSFRIHGSGSGGRKEAREDPHPTQWKERSQYQGKARAPHPFCEGVTGPKKLPNCEPGTMSPSGESNLVVAST